MLLLAQIPGVDDAIKVAASQGWLEVTFVVIVLATFTSFGWMLKHLTVRHSAIEERMQTDAIAREVRLSQRVDALSDTIRTELITTLRENSQIMGKMITASDSICRAAESMTETVKRFTDMMDSGLCPMSGSRRENVA